MISKVLLVIGLMMLIAAQLSLANDVESDECLYNLEAIGKPKFLQRSDFTRVEWNDKEKVANVVTKQKEELVVRYSACENVGVEAELSMDAKDSKMTQKYLTNRILWLTNNILSDQEENQVISNVLRQHEFTELFRRGIYNKRKALFNIPSKRYMEMTLGVEFVKNKLILSLVAISF